MIIKSSWRRDSKQTDLHLYDVQDASQQKHSNVVHDGYTKRLIESMERFISVIENTASKDITPANLLQMCICVMTNTERQHESKPQSHQWSYYQLQCQFPPRVEVYVCEEKVLLQQEEKCSAAHGGF